MSKALKSVWSVITTLIVIAALVLALLLAGVRLVGMQVFVVLSGSMEPTYHTGSLIYVKKTDPFTLQNGDVITFMLDEDTLATHRIVGVVPDEEDPSVIRFRTKGDANENEDGTLVHYKNVVGVPVFTIPKLGYVADYIQHPPGLYVTIAVGAFLMLLMFMPELVSAIKGDEEPEKEKPAKKEKAKKEKPHKEKAPAVKAAHPRRRQEAQHEDYPEESIAEPQTFEPEYGAAYEPEETAYEAPREQRHAGHVAPAAHERRASHEGNHSHGASRRGGSHVKGRHEK